MSTYTQIYYHIIFSTKNRMPCLKEAEREKLFKYIWGIINNKGCHLYRINGVEDHIHVLTGLKPAIALADLVKDIKVASSIWINEQNLFPRFEGWQVGYAAFTYADKDKNTIINYIKSQVEHHRKRSYREEVEVLLKEHGIDFDERFLV
ncbi:MAG: IS200/IS605 family transposase [Candidatus Marinimicrobia bacterium]|nr:IS200/IS605 family transposase [Candidatus Neomarinimicrobiota bacterium]